MLAITDWRVRSCYHLSPVHILLFHSSMDPAQACATTKSHLSPTRSAKQDWRCYRGTARDVVTRLATGNARMLTNAPWRHRPPSSSFNSVQILTHGVSGCGG